MRRGIEVTRETIGADVIRRVGSRGSFLMEDHTLDYLRSGEFRETKASNTMTYGTWLKAGAPDSAAVAGRKAAEMLKSGSANRLDDARSSALNKIIMEFEKEL